MAKIAMIGAGMMASGMVERWCSAGEQVHVWNRTSEKARALEKFGAKAFDDPAAAVQGVESIHIMLSDDASVDRLFDRILERIAKGTLTIDHTTVSPQGTLARFERTERAGIEFLHAPVFMSPQATRDGGGVMLASGPRARFERAQPELKRMTGDLWYLGERPDKAAAFKLFGNELIVFIVAGLADVYMLAKGLGIEPAEAHELFSHFKPSVTVDIRGKKMAAGDFGSAFDLAMARKDVRLMLEAAAANGVEMAVLPEIARRMDAMIERGYGAKDVGVLAADALGESRVPAGHG
ncbi:MAG: NAD(P)-dependent oxidoreductase [Candidatus Eremiobacteraeota bacterium]|nr:NAD(P)-dependent oxidoreductase [Candidatus Eremiobacteraeota bacterium]